MPRMSLGDHLEELRRRLIYALIGLGLAAGAGLLVARRIIELLKGPYLAAMAKTGMEADLAVLSPTAGFTAYLKVALLGGAILAAPWVFYQLWAFVSAGLYARERRYVQLAVPFSAGLFVGGALFFLAMVSRPALVFLLSFNQWLGLRPVITLRNYVSFIVALALVAGLAFQTPLIILVLAKIGLVTRQSLSYYRRHVIVAVLVLAALLSPPDVFTQLALAVPVYILYELSILLVRLFIHQPTRPGQAPARVG